MEPSRAVVSEDWASKASARRFGENRYAESFTKLVDLAYTRYMHEMQGIYSGKRRVFRAGTIGVICPRIGKWVLRGFGMAEHH